jgi:hypothetical protein
MAKARAALADDEGVDVGAKYVSVCDKHGTMAGASTVKAATCNTTNFCEECRENKPKRKAHRVGG